MSLLMDALKKAENAKKLEEREKQKGSADENKLASTTNASSTDSPLEAFAAESTADDASAELTLEESDDTGSELHKDTPATGNSDDDDFIFSLDNSEQAVDPEKNSDASEDHKITQQLNAPELIQAENTGKETSAEENLGATMQINVPDALRLANNPADKTDLALKSNIPFSTHDTNPASSEPDNSDATLEAIEDLFNDAPPATQPLPEAKLPPIDYEALTALKSGHQAQAQQMFKGKKQSGNNINLLLWSTVAILLVAIIVIATWYVWTISELQTETQLPATAEQTEAMPAAQGIVGTDSAATNPQNVVTIAAVDAPQRTPQEVPANHIEAPDIAPASEQPMVPATPPVSNTEFPTAIAENDSSSAITIKKGVTTSRIDKRLRKAWNDFQQGDTDRAEKTYRKILQDEPLNRDALLGKAAIALRHNDLGTAHQLYSRLLQRDPQDALAQSALISLLGRQDPVAGISRINILLEKNPKAPWLHFALGNLYAQQTRWIESQQAYFHAWTLDQNNPDYAYNLAIAMDHLGKQQQALKFYQKAMDLAESRPISFPTGQVIQRINSINSTQ